MDVEYNGKRYKADNSLKLKGLGIRKITDIKGLDQLLSLKKLDLDKNEIEDIEGLDNLRELEELSLQDNNIKEVKGLEYLTSLKNIFLHGNPVYDSIKKNIGSVYRKDAQILVRYCQSKSDIKIIPELLTTQLNRNLNSEIQKNQLNVSQVNKIPENETHVSFRDKFADLKANINPYIDVSEMVKKIIKYEYENNKQITKLEMVKELDLTFDDVEIYNKMIKRRYSYNKTEHPRLKNLAEKVIKQFQVPTLYDLMFTFNLNYEDARKLGKFLIKEGWIYELPDFPSKTRIKFKSDIESEGGIAVETGAIEKIKQMIKVSDRIKLDLMRKALRMDEITFSEKIFDWAEKYDFRIDGDILIINKDTADEFISTLGRNETKDPRELRLL